jgi:acyl-CoA-binding protein
MTLLNDFLKASEDVKKLSTRPNNETLLELYALFKQATEGDLVGNRPGLLDIKGRAKYDAWSKKKSTSKDSAMTEYISLVAQLLK